MAVCIQKRVYNESTLESWRGKIAFAWETFFTKPELNLGREIFRNGEIRELELNESDIIVHARFDQDECYALIEWDKGAFTVRGSTKDKLLARSLAVAGLYDVEGLLAKDADNNSNSALAVPDRILLKEQSLKSRKASAIANQSARGLSLEFYLSKQGLHFKAYWVGKDKTKIAALKSDEYTPGETNASEREKLIGLASLARKCGFKFSSSKGDYSLKDIPKIMEFINGEIDKKWKSRFDFYFDKGVECLRKGVQNADIVVDLDGSDEGTLDFCWNMNVAECTLDAEDARDLIRKTGEVVLMPELGMVQLEMEKTELLATWRRWLDLYSDGRIPRYVLFSSFGEDPIRMVLSTELKKWKDSLFHLPQGDIGDVPEFLRPYQRQGVRWLSHLCDRNCHGLLADEMGLGKTIQVLSFITSRAIYDLPNLIVCPASVVPVWEKEIERFFPNIEVQVLKGGNDFYKCDRQTLWISSYTQLRIHKYLLDATEFGYVILDEAQLIKNPEAKVTQACLRIWARHRIVLTGTPLENKYLDLWTLFRFLMPGLLGTRRHFETQVTNDSKKVRDQIKKQIAPFVLRRTKKDVLKELPAKTEAECICPLTDLQREEYTRLSKDGVKELGEDLPKAVRERSLSFLTLLTRLRQTCCDPSLLPWMDVPTEQSGKIMVLVEKLTEILANGHKVVIFSQFVSLLARIEKAIKDNFSDIPVYQLTGKTLDRAKPVAGFQDQGDSAVMLVSLRAGGTGITLHSADYVFLMDPWWNPAVEEQAIDRVHRFGQDKPVFVYRMITEGTIEARIQKLKSEKKGIFSGILGEMNDISNMKNYFDSLSDLIALLPDED